MICCSLKRLTRPAVQALSFKLLSNYLGDRRGSAVKDPHALALAHHAHPTHTPRGTPLPPPLAPHTHTLNKTQGNGAGLHLFAYMHQFYQHASGVVTQQNRVGGAMVPVQFNPGAGGGGGTAGKRGSATTLLLDNCLLRVQKPSIVLLHLMKPTVFSQFAQYGMVGHHHQHNDHHHVQVALGRKSMSIASLSRKSRKRSMSESSKLAKMIL